MMIKQQEQNFIENVANFKTKLLGNGKHAQYGIMITVD